MGLEQLQPLSAGTADAGAGAGGQGHGGEDWGCDDGVWGDVAFVGGCVAGGGGGVAHLEGEAVVFVDEEVGAGEGDVVGEGGAVLVDVVAVWWGGVRKG